MNDSHEADAAAMARLRDGDDLALNELMARWQKPLASYLMRFCGNEATALDLAQDTFVRVYEARARYDTRGKFATWLYTIAGNLARNSHRWQQRHPSVSLDAPTDENGGTLATHLPDAAPAPDESADAGRTRDRRACNHCGTAGRPADNCAPQRIRRPLARRHCRGPHLHAKGGGDAPLPRPADAPRKTFALVEVNACKKSLGDISSCSLVRVT